MIDARSLAVEILEELDEGKKLSTFLINEKENLVQAEDRPLIRNYIYGVLENRSFLDSMIQSISDRKLDQMDPYLLNLLRLAFYELHFLSKPSYAVVYEAVELAKRRERRSASFINGVLQNFLRKKEEILQLDRKDLLSYLSIRYSHPRWIVDKMRKEFSLKKLEEILIKNNSPAPISLFIRPDRISRDQAFEVLKKDLLNVRKSKLSPYVLLADGGDITGHKLFQEGMMTIQSQPSLLVAQMAVEGFEDQALNILDLCAAPGSKALAMAVLAKKSQVLANDLSLDKKMKIEENIERFQISNMTTSIWDGRKDQKEWHQAFDVVLVDAPCSGLGLLRRKPDIRYLRKEEDILSLAQLQKDIVKKAMAYVKKDGRLVYSTCTYGKEENEDIVSTILETNSFEIESFQERKAWKFSPLVEDADGFFMIRFRKKEQ